MRLSPTAILFLLFLTGCSFSLGRNYDHELKKAQEEIEGFAILCGQKIAPFIHSRKEQDGKVTRAVNYVVRTDEQIAETVVHLVKPELVPKEKTLLCVAEKMGNRIEKIHRIEDTRILLRPMELVVRQTYPNLIFSSEYKIEYELIVEKLMQKNAQ